MLVQLIGMDTFIRIRATIWHKVFTNIKIIGQSLWKNTLKLTGSVSEIRLNDIETKILF